MTAVVSLLCSALTTHITFCSGSIDPPCFLRKGKQVEQESRKSCNTNPQGVLGARGGSSICVWLHFALFWPEVFAAFREEDVYIVEGYYIRRRSILSPLLSLGACPPPSPLQGRESIGRSCSCEAQQCHGVFLRKEVHYKPSQFCWKCPCSW